MQAGMKRRDFLAGTFGAVGLGACARRRTVAYRPLVSVMGAPAYSQDVYATMRQVLAEHRLTVRGLRVILKPNLVEYEPGNSINTHPLVVHAAMEAFRESGAAVTIAEGPGHRRNTLDLAEAAGYFDVIPHFEGIFTDLNLDDVTRIHLPRPVSRLSSLYLPNTVLSCDLLVSMPKLKTHHWAGATLSMKNLFGVVPGGVYGWPKNVLHWAGIAPSIVDLHSLFPHHFSIVDGIVGMEGNGPIQGRPKQVGAIVSGGDPIAVDATCCRIMKIEPKRIEYLAMAASPERMQEGNIGQIGERPDVFATPFDLPANMRPLRVDRA